MTARDQRWMTALALLSSAFVLVACLLGAGAEIAYAGPVLVLAIPLLAGRFPGEQRIERIVRTARRARRPVPAGRVPVRALRSPRILPRGGRLIATSLAVRPPPAVAATA